MRQKALILGAKPPFNGPWVPIGEAKKWSYQVECNPVGANLDGQLSIRVVDSLGRATDLPSGGFLSGVKAQARVDVVPEVKFVSVFIEEAEDV